MSENDENADTEARRKDQNELMAMQRIQGIGSDPVCPSCGYCPTCGRRQDYRQYRPVYGQGTFI